MSGLLRGPEDAADAGTGGKAAGLALLHRLGAPVPPWQVIPADAAAARAWRVDAQARNTLLAAFDTLAAAGDGGLAIRSSAAHEDDPHASHAGIFETRFADTAEGLLPAIEAVVDSAATAAAQAYGAWSRDDAPPRMAVILQSRIAPACAGVLFSADPADADPGVLYLEAVRGLGTGLADGTGRPARARLDAGEGRLLSFDPGADGPDALPGDFLRDLAGLLPRLEDAFDAPLDIEWAIDHAGRWWLLQARPITVLAARPRLAAGACLTSWFFDQRFAEPIHPISQTTLLPLIADIALGDALRMRGIAPDAALLQFHAGQAYVPHAVWRAMLRGAPRRFLSADLRQLFPEHCACEAPRGRFSDLPDYAWCALRAVFRERNDVFRNLRAWRRFEGELADFLAAWRAPAPGNPAAWEAAWRDLDAWTRRFLQIHRWSILWADYGYRAYRVATRLLPRRIRATLEHALHARTELVTTAANAALLRNHTLPPEHPEHAGFDRAYGHRARSLDLAAPTWSELARIGRLHEAAPHAAAPARARHGGGLDPPAWTAPLLHLLCRLLELRESQRFAWERILSRQRGLLRAAGAHLHARGALPEAGAVNFLTWEELRAALDGRPAPDAPALARRRHAHRVHSRVRRPLFLGAAGAPGGTSGALHGLGASPGIARGRVVLMPPHARPRPLGPGDIAVLTALDPAWTARMAHAGGLIIERGGLLSHAAILAREYGIPLVIGVEHATERLRPGQPVEINGDTGAILPG